MGGNWELSERVSDVKLNWTVLFVVIVPSLHVLTNTLRHCGLWRENWLGFLCNPCRMSKQDSVASLFLLQSLDNEFTVHLQRHTNGDDAGNGYDYNVMTLVWG